MGCQSATMHTTSGLEPSVDPKTSNQSRATANQSSLTPELMYDLLVSSIALQRNNQQAAVESLSRAAYQSRDPRVVARAIQLSMQTHHYQEAADLARLFHQIDPDNYRVTTSLARAQFELGENDQALQLLIDLAAAQSQKDISVFHEIATLISQQSDKPVLNDYQKLSEPYKDNLGVNMTGTILSFRLEQADTFIRYVDNTLRMAPNWEAPAILKLTYLSGKDHELADKFATEYISKNSEQERFRLQYVRILIQSNDFSTALNELDEVIRLNPESLDGLYTAGVIHLELQRYDQALIVFQRYFKIDSSNDQVRMYLAELELQRENYDTAMRYLYGVASEQFYLDAQIQMARIMAERGELKSATRHLEQVDSYNQEDLVRLVLEQDYLFRTYGTVDQAKNILDDALQRFPDNPDLLYNRGLLAAQMELLPLHESDMRRLIEIEPDNAHAYNALGYTLADKTDRLEEAMSLITKANDLLPDNPFILDSMGWVHFRLGNNTEALKFLKQALDGRQDPEIAAHLGEVLWIMGKPEEALNIWSQGQQWEPENSLLIDTIKRFSDSQSNFLPEMNFQITTTKFSNQFHAYWASEV